jgi:hypothetical protein
MGRPRKVYPTALESELRALVARGESAQVIHAALRGAIPVSTIGRRQAELRRGGAAPPRSSLPGAPPADDVPDQIPSDASDDDVERWLRRLEKAAAQAERDGNLAALASLGAKFTALKALQRKHAPLPAARPEDNPDYLALAAAGEDRLLRLVEGLFNEPSGLQGEGIST